ncbi:hypothetical protein MMC07_004493 [Pseudocyphellaria aurata]|nr:hypothetical protein [Pseudocyphellaria aurata]
MEILAQNEDSRHTKEILEIFPDISRDHVRQLYEVEYQKIEDDSQRANISQIIILGILDAKTYPKEKDKVNELKRKRSNVLDSDEEEAARWRDSDRGQDANVYFREARMILQEEFGSVPSKFIDSQLKLEGNFYAAYLALDVAEYKYLESNNPGYTRLKQARKVKNDAFSRLDNMEATGYGLPELKKEIQAARQRRKKEDAKRQIMKDAATAAAAIDKEYRDNGDIMECQCCFDSYAMNKITHCNGEETHFFCIECAERNAKTEIGNSRYKLTCMDGSGCKASFSREQKDRFLDTKSLEALDRMQQQAELRLAKLPNYVDCPFCDFGAICPPVHVDKEFRCGNEKCEKISCRLCKLESHVPLTCEESRKENGISERHVIEEARTLALLRTCPKCKVSILKEDGCNKVVCTCGGMLCDYCGKDISAVGYVHFDGGTGPASKKCPTYDNFRVRRNKEVEKAEAEALKKIRLENPDIDADDLKIRFAETIKSPSKHDQDFVPGNQLPRDRFPHPNHFHIYEDHYPGHLNDFVDNNVPDLPPYQHIHHRPRPELQLHAAQRHQQLAQRHAQQLAQQQAYMNQLNQRAAALQAQPQPAHQQNQALRAQHNRMAMEAELVDRARFRRLNPGPNDGLVPRHYDRDIVEQDMGLNIEGMARDIEDLERRQHRQGRH